MAALTSTIRPVVVDRDHGVQRGVEHRALAGLAVVHGGELPDLAAEAGERRQQGVVGLVRGRGEELHHPARRPERDREGGVQPDLGGLVAAREVRVGGDVLDPGRGAARPHPPRQPFARRELEHPAGGGEAVPAPARPSTSPRSAARPTATAARARRSASRGLRRSPRARLREAPRRRAGPRPRRVRCAAGARRRAVGRASTRANLPGPTRNVTPRAKAPPRLRARRRSSPPRRRRRPSPTPACSGASTRRRRPRPSRRSAPSRRRGSARPAAP